MTIACIRCQAPRRLLGLQICAACFKADPKNANSVFDTTREIGDVVGAGSETYAAQAHDKYPAHLWGIEEVDPRGYGTLRCRRCKVLPNGKVPKECRTTIRVGGLTLTTIYRDGNPYHVETMVTGRGPAEDVKALHGLAYVWDPVLDETVRRGPFEFSEPWPDLINALPIEEDPMKTEKIVRTPREWTEPCARCGGTGNVQKRERFALWTPDEYASEVKNGSLSVIDPKHDVPKDAYVCQVMGGSDIWGTCREAVDIAIRVDRPVAFLFNDTIAVCRSDSDPEKVAREWWKRCYGKTPEESMRDR